LLKGQLKMSVKSYTKRDISRQVAENLDLPHNLAHKVLSESFSVMREILSDDYKNIRIEIRNFGTLLVKPTKAKPKARNPRTNEVIYVPPHKKTHFKPGMLLKKELKKPL